MHNVSEYCRVHDMTPQSFFTRAPVRNISSTRISSNSKEADHDFAGRCEEIKGRFEPIDDLLQMIEEDKRSVRKW